MSKFPIRVAFWLGATALALSMAWMIYEPGFQQLVSIFTSGALTAATYHSIHVTIPRQSSEKS